GSKANSFLVILKGKALVLNSLGNEVFGVIQENQSFGLIEILKNVKWKNTIVSEKKSEILFVPRDKLIKNIFSNKLLTNLTLNILKMAR
ncbi:MAG: cyclic nucleotide-binding domain-containing protein, partial [Pseudomonadota bacterium]|nr:cyclic nucleotide-binding domain-containing protein [Pseudomonadota bacterium]